MNKRSFRPIRRDRFMAFSISNSWVVIILHNHVDKWILLLQSTSYKNKLAYLGGRWKSSFPRAWLWNLLFSCCQGQVNRCFALSLDSIIRYDFITGLLNSSKKVKNISILSIRTHPSKGLMLSSLFYQQVRKYGERCHGSTRGCALPPLWPQTLFRHRKRKIFDKGRRFLTSDLSSY